MSFFSRLIESRVETRDHHEDSRLRTQYFKTNKNRLMEACLNWIKQEPTLTLLDESNDRGEIAAKVKGGRKGLLVLTIVPTRPMQTAVDVSFAVDRGLNMGYGQKLCASLYAKLGKEFDRVGRN